MITDLRDNQKYAEDWYKKRDTIAYRICNILKSEKNHSNPVVLDIGCHEGDMENIIKQYTNNMVIGLELSLVSIKHALRNTKKTNLKNIEFVCASLENLPIKNECIDWIICNYVDGYLKKEDKINAFNQFERILKRNGLVYFTTGGHFFIKIFKLAPFMFESIVGKYYGRVNTSSKQWMVVETYHFWMKKVLENRNLRVDDKTSMIIYNEFIHKLKLNKFLLNIIRKIMFKAYRVFRDFSPSWIFVYYKN